MLVKTEALVIHTRRYGEADLIVKLFTKKEGVISYLIRGVLKSKKGKLKSALFLPLSHLYIDAAHNPKAALKRLIEAKLIFHYKSLHQSIIKGSILAFLTEILSQILIEGHPDEDLYEFLTAALLWLDSNEEASLFHVFFLLELTKFLGCYPEHSNSELPLFDLEEASFSVGNKGGYILEGELLESFKLLLGINFDTLKEISLSKHIRKQLLDKMLLYYSFHVAGFKKPKSLSVLEAIFNPL